MSRGHMVKKTQIDYERFCKEVLCLNSKIRFASILNRNGKNIAGGYREYTSSLLSNSEIKISLQYAFKRWENRGNLAHRIGETVYSMTEYEKIKQITIPIGKTNLLLISTEINVNHSKILEKVSVLINEHFQGLLLKH